MTVIVAACGSCGRVELGTEEITLGVCGNLPDRSFYSFTCPCCEGFNRKPADDRIVEMLVSGGVPALRWDVPAEALEVHAGPTITADDILDFALGDLDRALASLVGAA